MRSTIEIKATVGSGKNDRTRAWLCLQVAQALILIATGETAVKRGRESASDLSRVRRISIVLECPSVVGHAKLNLEYSKLK